MVEFDAWSQILSLAPKAKSPEVLVLCEKHTQRLMAACDFIFSTTLQCRYKLVKTSPPELQANQVLINYALHEVTNGFHIVPSGFLSETGTPQFEPLGFEANNQTYFFKTQGHIAFDIFSAVFYFVSRYEEWQSFEADEHQRFELKASLLFKHKCHKKPLVDQWILEFKHLLEVHSANVKFTSRRFQVISTLDIDNLYAFKEKGWIRSIGATGRDFLKLDFKNILNRLTVLTRLSPDPFDVYDELGDFCFEHKIPFVCFFLQRSGTKYDRTVNPQSTVFARAIQSLKKNHAFLGLHPSYDASLNAHYLQEEMKYLETSAESKIQMSRQHYLRFNIKTTPHDLLKAGIRFDFTMGFATGSGFRAGTSLPFKYYDFTKESQSDLCFVPFCAMDGAWSVYGNQNATEALEDLLDLAREIKAVNGMFVTVFHERSFYDHLYKGFGTLYKKLFERVAELKSH
jgi:hypothetical protein